MSNEVVEIAGKHLGADSAYSEHYDYDLLDNDPDGFTSIVESISK